MLKQKSKTFWENLAFIVTGVICVFSWYFYRPQIIAFWNNEEQVVKNLAVDSWNNMIGFSGIVIQNSKEISMYSLGQTANVLSSGVQTSKELCINSWNAFINTLKNISLPSFSFKFPSFSFGNIFGTQKIIKNCGTSKMPDLKNPSTYEDNAVLDCLGQSALVCEDAEAILTSDLFPDTFTIVKKRDSCNFKLSYSKDSALLDSVGKKLALQYISCPINSVKALDETNPEVPLFKNPNTDNLSKYASQIYFYGTLGVFVESNIAVEKMQSFGCSGDYISSVIASYKKMQSSQ